MGLPKFERGCCVCSLETFGYVIGGFFVLISVISTIILILSLHLHGGAFFNLFIGKSVHDTDRFGLYIDDCEVFYIHTYINYRKLKSLHFLSHD